MNTVLLAADVVVRTSTGEAVTFWVLGALALVGAVGVVTSAKAVYSAMFLAMTMLILAVFYFAQDAMFLGVVQIVVYTGAVMMLFLFVMMLIGVDSAESLVETLRGQRISATLAGTGFGMLLISGIGGATMHLRRVGTPATATGGGTDLAQNNVEGLAALIFTRYLWAFELTSALLITAVVAAMVLTHRERLQPRMTQRELSIRRFQAGHHPTPLPTPGVYARHNAVDIAARLPDGSYSALSVSDTLTHRWVGATGNAAHAADDVVGADEEGSGQ
ncbi:NADH-quinone oxidoreductase subunit J [[Mycobacterium] nativiensis]|uniref:NADH-quinone oxidoreductase subunit J n=1 Tax=[Mycobacterium] nativiensis TaxID=2855503 RepID=A0ABU5XVV7_9MYCO|nr:NADH-quinone oxidoreductase subunit J [Mycolicibacter sp. MYC340]MEB3032124.1 NADH-quinone oxidoreductase subunit J [Mycolicibacter sp. MYC340]